MSTNVAVVAFVLQTAIQKKDIHADVRLVREANTASKVRQHHPASRPLVHSLILLITFYFSFH